MVKATRKSLEEIYRTLKPYHRVLTVACGGCTSVCLAGGQKEALALNDELAQLARRDRLPMQFDCFTAERQCNPEFVQDLKELVANCDCVLSTACGVGVQCLAEAFPATPAFPALDTLFLGADVDVGLYEERCRSCGECVLAVTGGICPVVRCSKGNFNGPCGGTRCDGTCEVGGGLHCAWNDIYERLKAQNRVQAILEYRPPRNWNDKGPATLVQRGYEARHAARLPQAEPAREGKAK